MDIIEKLNALKSDLDPQYASLNDKALLRVLNEADAIIRSRLYGYVDQPKKFTHSEDMAQITIAKRILYKDGADGETSHSENGIARQWTDGSGFNDVFKAWGLVPRVGSVRPNANDDT